MYVVEFYVDVRGGVPVLDMLQELKQQSATDKMARVLRNKMVMYMDRLKKDGTRSGYPVVKFLEDALWELRPLYVRIVFFGSENRYVLLHPFVKKTAKTPRREIERARAERDDWGVRRVSVTMM